MTITIPKMDVSKIRSGVKTGSIIVSKKQKRKAWRKRKHKKICDEGTQIESLF
jgi:hypothetical protein